MSRETLKGVAESASDDKFKVVGAGCGGLDEMRLYMRDDQTMWATLRFEVGQGRFARTKVVFVYFNGDKAPPKTKGQWAMLTSTAKKCLEGGAGSFNTAVEVKSVEEMTLEDIVDRVVEYFVVDGDTQYDSDKLLEEYRAQLAREKEEAEKRKQEEEQQTEQDNRYVGEAYMASQVGISNLFSEGLDAMKSVANGGLWNWLLVGPDPEALPLLGGGAGSVDEMRECALKHQDTVMFGILRISLGSGPLKRNHYLSVHIVGADVPAVQRGRMNSLRSEMEVQFDSLCNCQVELNNVAAEDLTLEHVVERLQGIVEADLSVEAFSVAFVEEQEAVQACIAEMKGSSGAPVKLVHADPDAPPNANLTVEEVARLVKVERTCNWSLIQPLDGAVVKRGGAVASVAAEPAADPAASKATAAPAATNAAAAESVEQTAAAAPEAEPTVFKATAAPAATSAAAAESMERTAAAAPEAEPTVFKATAAPAANNAAAAKSIAVQGPMLESSPPVPAPGASYSLTTEFYSSYSWMYSSMYTAAMQHCCCCNDSG